MKIIYCMPFLAILAGCASIPEPTRERPHMWATLEQYTSRQAQSNMWNTWQPSLTPVIQAAIQHHPDALSAISNWNSLLLQEETLNKSQLPMLTLNAGVTQSNITHSLTSTGSIQVTGIIDVFDKVRLAQKNGSWNTKMAESLYKHAVGQVTNTVLKRSIQAYYQKQMIQVFKRQMDMAKERAAIIQEGVNAGIMTDLTLQNAWQTHNTAINNYDQAVQLYQASVLQLVAWTRLSVPEIESAIDALNIEKTVDMPQLTGNELLKRHDVQAAVANAQALMYARMGYEKERYPTLSVTGSFSSQTIQSGITTDMHGITIGPFSVSIPLWDNGLIARKVLDGQSKEYVAWKKVEDVILKSMIEHRQNTMILQSQLLQQNREHNLILLNEEQQKDIEQQWKVGKISRLDYLSTLSNYQNIALQYINTASTRWMHYADYTYGLGLLS